MEVALEKAGGSGDDGSGPGAAAHFIDADEAGMALLEGGVFVFPSKRHGLQFQI
jgi:hypothetical protein